MGDTITPMDLWHGLCRNEVPGVVDLRNPEDAAAVPFEGPPGTRVEAVPIWRALDEPAELAGRIGEGTALICAQGHGSEMLVEMLAAEGRGSVSLEGGMEAWSRLLVVVPLEIDTGPADGIGIWQILRPAKGCLSYVLGVPGAGAVVVDPARFVDPYLDLLDAAGMRLEAVVDTHLHADHISGGPALAAAAGAPYLLPAGDLPGGGPGGEPEPTLRLDQARSIELLTLHLPGHTPGTTAVVVAGVALAAGDTLFLGGVGRPDLTGQADPLARELFKSIHERLACMPDDMLLLPAHWSRPGEIGPGGTVTARLGQVLQRDLLTTLEVDRFVEQVVGSLAPAPATYDRIREVNAGAATSEEELDLLEVGRNRCAAQMDVG